MLTLTSAKFAKTEELFEYKENNFKLKLFPGYTYDQWGIKAHNRPWIDDVGKFKKNERIIEVGGAYSTLPEFLSKKYKLEAWIGDDFGLKSKSELWRRWGDPKKHAKLQKNTKYVFEPFGTFSKKYPDHYFDKVFSVSTLEHIDEDLIIDVFKDMNRCTKVGGMQLHTIDIHMSSVKRCIFNTVVDKIPLANVINKSWESEIKRWKNVLQSANIQIKAEMPSPMSLLDRSVLVESPDVVFKLYPPKNKKKPYTPTASLLLIIEDL